MDKSKILRTDLTVQSIFMILVLVVLVLWLGLGVANYVAGLSAFLLLLSWQFFSGIYIAAELKRWYRGFIPMVLLLALVISILLLAVGLPMGIFIAFGLSPVIALTNFVIGVMDFRNNLNNSTLQRVGDEKILDSGDLF